MMNKAIDVVTAYLVAFPLNQSFKQSDLVEVWHSYILGYEKWLIHLKNSDLYFEITYNKETNDYYIDKYEKTDHRVLWH